jgi:hypothetical protein
MFSVVSELLDLVSKRPRYFEGDNMEKSLRQKEKVCPEMFQHT